MSTAEGRHPAWCPTDPTEADTCPGCGATHGVQRITGTPPRAQAGACAECRTDWAVSLVNPALSIVGLLPTPQLRTVALLAALRIEVVRRSGKGPGTMTVTVCLSTTEMISIDAMASVDTGNQSNRRRLLAVQRVDVPVQVGAESDRQEQGTSAARATPAGSR